MPKDINTIKSIDNQMARAIHYLVYVCKIGTNERDVIINCSTNNDKIYFDCEMDCKKQCIFKKREYQLVGKHELNSSINNS